MSVEIFDSETHENMAASDRNHNDMTIMESEYWSTDEPSEQGLESIHEDGSQSLMQTGNLCSKQQILDTVFQMCDVEERGMVPVFKIIDYLKSVTDSSRDGKRLLCLRNMLDPDGGNTLVDLLTFQKAMSKWIERCWMDRDVDDRTEEELFIKDLQPSIIDIRGGSQPDEYGGYAKRYMAEHTDLSIKIAEFNCTNKKLTDEKTKIQRSLDLAEETNSILSEEISDLKSKLKSSQQAMQYSQTICNELEDTKILVKNLEEKISVVTAEKKQLEKDDILLRSQKQSLQDENDNLLSEKEKVKVKLDGLKVEHSKLLHQLYEYENLLVQKDELLTQKMIQAEELMGQVEEQKTLLQELKTEKNQLQEELLQTHEDKAIHSSLSHEECSGCLSLRSIHNEIEEIQKSNSYLKLELPDPFYQAFESSVGGEKVEKDIWTFTETKLEERSNILLKGLSCLTHLKCAWETYASKLNGAKTANTLCLLQRTRGKLPVGSVDDKALLIRLETSHDAASLHPDLLSLVWRERLDSCISDPTTSPQTATSEAASALESCS